MSLPQVLIVEDMHEYHEFWVEQLKEKATVISALSIEDAQKAFQKNPNLDAIVMDACVPGDEPTTIPLVKEFRAVFKGPMIAISGDPLFREMLIKAGCDHQCRKNDLAQELIEILGL